MNALDLWVDFALCPFIYILHHPLSMAVLLFFFTFVSIPLIVYYHQHHPLPPRPHYRFSFLPSFLPCLSSSLTIPHLLTHFSP
ncbi:hypothetical protein BKA57DRAFT_36243 [Linnemannia elongata]|nr:hypothetical protein BKA57DRAFT_36243 [Linnemannia elongata]